MHRFFEDNKKLCNEVMTTHGVGVYYAHEYHHVERVAALCLKIAPTEEVGILSAKAAMCHNADRILQKAQSLGVKGDIPSSQIEQYVRMWIYNSDPTTNESDFKRILSAVFGHDTLHLDGDDLVTVVLRDADRLDIMGALFPFRSGQFTRDSASALKGHNPHEGELIKSVKRCLEWADPNLPKFCVRTEKAWPLAKSRAAFLELLLHQIKIDMRETFEDS